MAQRKVSVLHAHTQAAHTAEPPCGQAFDALRTVVNESEIASDMVNSAGDPHDAQAAGVLSEG
jgi:hypothetical protein